jgi:hypothetical protein
LNIRLTGDSPDREINEPLRVLEAIDKPYFSGGCPPIVEMMFREN